MPTTPRRPETLTISGSDFVGAESATVVGVEPAVGPGAEAGMSDMGGSIRGGWAVGCLVVNETWARVCNPGNAGWPAVRMVEIPVVGWL